MRAGAYAAAETAWKAARMESISGSIIVAALIIGALLAFFFIVIGLPVWLYHRREVLKMKGTAKGETTSLSQRVAALEKRCEKLEEQVTQAHLLLADEQRQMDRKLAAMLPDADSPAEGGEAGKRGGKRRRTK